MLSSDEQLKPPFPHQHLKTWKRENQWKTPCYSTVKRTRKIRQPNFQFLGYPTKYLSCCVVPHWDQQLRMFLIKSAGSFFRLDENDVRRTCDGARLEITIRRNPIKPQTKQIWTLSRTFVWIFGFDYTFLNMKIWIQKTYFRFEFKLLNSSFWLRNLNPKLRTFH